MNWRIRRFFRITGVKETIEYSCLGTIYAYNDGKKDIFSFRNVNDQNDGRFGRRKPTTDYFIEKYFRLYVINSFNNSLRDRLIRVGTIEHFI